MAGYYSETDIDRLLLKLRVPGGSAYVTMTAKALAPLLIQSPQMYKLFGVYWWAIKGAIVRISPKPGAWFMGGFDDPLMKARAWHGDEFRTIFAGAYYQDSHSVIKNSHTWTDEEGNDHEYNLFDQDAGF